MNKIFELEQSIMNCWNILEDIKQLRKNVLEGGYNTDDTANYLLGLEYIYDSKFDNMFKEFEVICTEYLKLRKEAA